jgi:hypothetical protein
MWNGAKLRPIWGSTIHCNQGTSPINPGRIPCQWAIEEINCAPEVAKERERKRPGRLLYITGVLLLGTQLQSPARSHEPSPAEIRAILTEIGRAFGVEIGSGGVNRVDSQLNALPCSNP